MSASPSSRRCSDSAFSLLELLVVIAIVGIVAAMATSVLGGFGDSRKVTRALDGISSLLELARAEAMGKNTYVWVGFKDGTESGNSQLLAAAVASKDGTISTVSTNLYPITKPLKLDNIALASRGTLSSPLSNQLSAAGGTASDIATGSQNLTFPIGGTAGNVSIAKSIVSFTPQGEAMLLNPAPENPFTPIIEIALRATKGTTSPANAAEGVVWVYGGSGQTRSFRP